MSVKQERINQYTVFEKRMSSEFPASSLMIVDFMLTELCNRTCDFCPRAVDYPNLNLHMNLDLFNKSITGTGNVNITGIITATNFVGDGSGLTNVVGSGSGVIVKNSGSNVGTAGTIDFGNNLSVSPASAVLLP